MQYEKDKSKISIYSLIVSTALFVRGQFICSKMIEICFMVISSLQTLMMIIHPTFSSNHNIQVNTSLEALYTLLIRPELFIIINRNLQMELLYIFVLTIVIVHKFSFGVLVFVLHKNRSSDKFQQQIQHSLPIQIFVKFLSYYQQLLCPLCIVPFNTIILLSIQEQITLIQDGQSVNFVHLLFAILTFIILQIDQMTVCTINKQPLTYKLKSLERSKITESHFIIYLSQTLSVLIFTLMPDQFSLKIAQYFIVLIIQIIAIRNQYVNQIYIFLYQEICLYTGYIFQLIYSVIQFLNLQWQIDNQVFLLLVITPLLLGFILAFTKQKKNKQFLRFFQGQDFSDIDILINVLINILNKNDINESHIVLRSSLINHYHSKKCQLKTCGCATTYYIAEPKQANAITALTFKSFIFDKLQQIKKTIYQKNSSYYCSQDMLISYSILLYDFGWMMLAARSFNKLLLNDNKVPGSFTNAPALNKNELQKQTKEMTLKTATLLYKKFQTTAGSETANKNDMKIFFQIDLGIINKERILHLSNQTKWNMKATFGSSLNAAQQTFISDSINQYLKYEFVVQNCKEKLQHLIIQKNIYYSNLIKEKQQNARRIYRITNKICKLLNEDERYFRFSYAKYPSTRLQKALTFFYAELMNNMLEANRIYHQSVNSDLQFIQNNHSSLNLTQQQSAYVILSLNEDLKHIEVQSISNQMLKFIGKPHQTNICFSEILPLFFYQYHPEMVNEFLNSGKSRYYRNFSPTFINVHDCLFKGVQICFDTTQLYHKQQLVFVAFFQSLMYENSYIIVDDFDRNFVALSQNFLTKLGYDDNLIKKMIKHKYLNDLNIYNIFPQFDEALIRQGQDNKILIEDIYFFDYQKVRQSTIIENQEKRMSNLDPFIWRQKEKIMKFTARLSIVKRFSSSFNYFIIEIQDLEQQLKAVNTYDEVISDIDCETSKVDSSSFDGMISQRSDDHPNQINILETNHQLSLFSPTLQKNSNQNDTSVRHIQTQTRVTLTNQCEEKLLKQSNNSQIKINSMNAQQAFYNSKLSHLIGGQDKYSVIIDQEIESRNKDNQQEEQKQEYAQSQSSVASINMSVNFKKYELIQKITSIRPSLKINQFIGFLLFENFILIIYLILVLVIMPDDLKNSQEEINMIGFHADIMAPHDLFFSMRITISSYQQLLTQKFINSTQFKELTDPYYNNINLGYEELKNSLYIQLSNSYIQKFYDDQNFEAKLMSVNDSTVVTQTITFREVLLTVLQYQYAYMRIYQQQQSPSGKPGQVFLYANYFNIHDMLEQIADDILQSSKSRSLTVIQKWLILWLALVVLIILVSLLTFYFHNEHLIQYDRFLYLLNYFTLSYLEQEINKQKILQQIIQHDENYIFSYEFNLDRNYVKPEKQISSTHIQFKEQKYKKKLKMSRVKAILFALLLASLYITYSTLVNQTNQTFFNRFLQTTDFYKQVADMKLRAGSIILQKEIFYRLSNFTYLTSQDIDRLYQYVAKALSVISNYIIEVNAYDFNNLLVSDSFVTEYIDIETNNLCHYLSAEFSAFMFDQCNLAFAGTLTNGTIPSLNYIVNEVKAEQAMNNFTQRIDVHMYEQEGSQVITRVFTQLSLALANTIVQIINSQFYFCQSLSIVFFAFAIIWTIIIIKWFRNYLISEHDLIKKIVNIAPSQMLITDDSYERQLRLIAQQQETY